MAVTSLDRRVMALGSAGAAAFALAGALHKSAARPAPGPRSDVTPRLRRGVNLHHWLNWPQLAKGAGVNYSAWPFSDAAHAMAPGEARAIAAAGFDFVRLTMDPAIHIASPPARRPELAAMVMERVRALASAGLGVVLDLHPVSQNPALTAERLTAAGAPAFSEFAALVGRMAAALAASGLRGVALELFNEPPMWRPEELARWQTSLEQLHAAARNAAPTLPLVLSGGRWSAPAQLRSLDIRAFRGSAVIYTFHYYDPHAFTHQGVEREYGRYIRDLPWPGTPADAEAGLRGALSRMAADAKLSGAGRNQATAELRRLIDEYRGVSSPAAVAQAFATVGDWGRRNGIEPGRILLGEFGAVRQPNEGAAARRSRLAWLKAVRESAEAQGFPWAVWALKGPGGMALIQDNGSAFDPEMMRALAMAPASEPRRRGGREASR